MRGGGDRRETAGDGRDATHLIDTHAGPVAPEVWALFEEAVRLGARAPVLLEWDADIPSFERVHAEALRAREFIDRALAAAGRRRGDRAPRPSAEQPSAGGPP